MMTSCQWLRRSLLIALVMSLGLALGSCGSDANNNSSFRMIQASQDLALVNLLVDDVILRTAIDYRGGPGFLTVTPKTYKFGIDAIVVGSDGLVANVPLFTPVEKQLAADTEYTLISIGKASTGTVQPLIVENRIQDVPTGYARLQFVHAAPDAPPVLNIYVTAVPDSPGLLPDLAGETPIAQVTYGQQPDPWQLALPDVYVIRVTPVDSTVPLFESKEIALYEGNDLLMVAVDNVAAGTSPISLAVNSGFRAFYNPAGTFDIFDKDSPSDLRVVQVSPDSPPMDILGVPDTEIPIEKTFATGLGYLDYTGYVPAVPYTYTLRGVPTSDPGTTTPYFFITGNLLIGQRTTLYTTGLVGDIVPLVLVGDVRPIFAEGKLRLVNASPASGTVDVYILANGIPITDQSPTLQNLAFRVATPYVPFFPRNYTVTFTVPGEKTVLATVDVAAGPGSVQTAVLVDAVRVDGSDGTPASVLLTDDLAI